MILANITILPLWATCVPWNAIVPMPICAAFRSLPSPTARCSRALRHGNEERAGAGRRRKPTVRFTAAERPSATQNCQKHISSRSCKNAEHRSRPRLRCCVCMGTALRRSPRGTSWTRGVCAGCSRVCIPPICGSVGTERRRKMKDQHTRMLHGRLLRPLKVGSSALIDHEGQFILTSLVTSIQVQNEQEAKFETLNTHYHVKFSPLQAAVAASILMAVAA